MRGVVVIPAFNEEESIGSVLDRIRAEDDGAAVVVVDDGSRDRTGAVAAAHGARVLTHLINLGYARALQTGIRFALATGCDYCVTIDADGQHDPAYIKGLRARASEADAPAMVIGSRWVEDGRYKAPPGRKLGMMIFSWLTAIIAGRRIYDTTSGFKWMSRAAMAQAAEISAGDLHSEMIIYSLLRGLLVVETPMVVKERLRGQSMYGAISGLVYPLKTLLSIAVLLVQARRQGRHA